MEIVACASNYPQRWLPLAWRDVEPGMVVMLPWGEVCSGDDVMVHAQFAPPDAIVPVLQVDENSALAFLRGAGFDVNLIQTDPGPSPVTGE